MAAVEWSHGFPQEEGWYWFYGCQHGIGSSSARMELVRVFKTASGSLMFIGSDVLNENYGKHSANGAWAKADIPEPPAQGVVSFDQFSKLVKDHGYGRYWSWDTKIGVWEAARKQAESRGLWMSTELVNSVLSMIDSGKTSSEIVEALGGDADE